MRPFYAGNALATVKVAGDKKVVTAGDRVGLMSAPILLILHEATPRRSIVAHCRLLHFPGARHGLRQVRDDGFGGRGACSSLPEGVLLMESTYPNVVTFVGLYCGVPRAK